MTKQLGARCLHPPNSFCNTAITLLCLISCVGGCSDTAISSKAQEAESQCEYAKVKEAIVFIWRGISYKDILEPKLTNGKVPPRLLPAGTGFFVTLDVETPEHQRKQLTYIVTAAHVAQGNLSITYRFNRLKSANDLYYVRTIGRSEKVIFGRDGVDLALIPVLEGAEKELSDKNCVLGPSSICANEDLEKQWRLTEGAPVFSLGYLKGIFSAPNEPVYRFGRIALNLPKGIKLPIGDSVGEACFIDASGGRGMSGAPVFLDEPSGAHRLVGVWKANYNTDEYELPEQLHLAKDLRGVPSGQQLSIMEPGRNLYSLIQDVCSDLKKDGYKILNAGLN